MRSLRLCCALLSAIGFVGACSSSSDSSGPEATTTALVASVNPVSAGNPVTFTATVTASSGIPGGTMAFKDDGSDIPSCASRPMAAGQASCTISTLPVGAHAINAAYSGTSSFEPSSATAVNLTVTP